MSVFKENICKIGDEEYLSESDAGARDCRSTRNGYVCTRSVGHEGAHAAHGEVGHQYAAWTDDATEPEAAKVEG